MTHFPSSAAIITSDPRKKGKNVEFSDKQMRDFIVRFLGSGI